MLSEQEIVVAALLLWVCATLFAAIKVALSLMKPPPRQKPRYRLIGISGKFGVGKDTAAEWIREMHPEYKIVPFADALKRVVAIMTSTTYESQFTREGKAAVPDGLEHSVAKYQQIVGMLAREQFGENVWVNIALKNPAEYKIIPDVRFENEARAIVDAGGLLVRIVRKNTDGTTCGRDPNHISETALDKYSFEHVIVNNGTLEDFKKKISWTIM